MRVPELGKSLLQMLADGLDPDGGIMAPTSEQALRDALWIYAGLRIPDAQVCPNHCTPWQAFRDAYFATEHSTAVWKASRGLGGKSLMLAALAYMEAITLGAAVNILGGSGEQSKNVHGYMTGEHENVPDTFWHAPGAPRDYLLSDPSAYTTRLTNRGRIKVLTASQKSVRGPHPQRLRIDEVDEVAQPILDAALGQPMASRGIREHTVLSSTHQYAGGTMTEVLHRAADRGWPVYEWCYRESMAGPAGWLTPGQVERKRALVTVAMWDTEYELQEPQPGMRAIDATKVDEAFTAVLGEYAGAPDEYIEIEPPHTDGTYVTGADWARKVDWTVIVTLRVDVWPIRLVAFERTGRKPWPVMVSKYNDRLRRYVTREQVREKGTGYMYEVQHTYGAHDATGLGDVVHSMLEGGDDVMPVQMVGARRSNMLSTYIAAVEEGAVVMPRIRWMHNSHKNASTDDVYGGGQGSHLPDDIAAMALAYRLAARLVPGRTTVRSKAYV